MTINETLKKICHKSAQLKKAEERLVQENSAFNLNNYMATKRALHQYALDLAKATE